eukprot:1034972-Alexandrium_andersonii.AAC.1
MVALPPTQAATAAGPAHSAHSPVPPPAPQPVARPTQPLSAASFPPGTARPDGYIRFAVWVGAQEHAVWAHRTWTAWDLVFTVAGHAGYNAEQAAL